MTLEIGYPLQQGRYSIQEMLGQGGMGTVYLATDRNLPGRLVAIKENTDASRSAQEQFQHEAVMLSRLTHPNLPRVTDHFVEPSGLQYLVMDYIEGDDLRTILEERDAPLPEAAILEWVEQVMNALEYMHGWIDPATRRPSPIIHRDIKPGNIKRTPNGRIVLVDFGLAKYEGFGEGTMIGARAFTAGYSPVEQYTGGGTDVRSDIYALGATLYTLLTGQRPPDSPALAAGVQLTPPRQLNPQLSRNTERVILRAMQVQAQDRYQSVAELRDALQNRRSITVRKSNQTRPTTDYVLSTYEDPPRRRSAAMIMGGIGLFLALLLTIGIALRAPNGWQWNGFARPDTLSTVVPIAGGVVTATLTAADWEASPSATATATVDAGAAAAVQTATAPLINAAITTTTTGILATLIPLTETIPSSAVPPSTTIAAVPVTANVTPTTLPTATPSATASLAVAPSATPPSTSTPDPTATATQPPTSTATPQPTVTATSLPTLTPTDTATPIPTATSTPPPTVTPTTTPPPTATPTAVSTSTATPRPTATRTATPTGTATVTPTVPPTPPPTATPTNAVPVAGEVRINPRDNAAYVFVPGGEFIMGSTIEPDEMPEHRVEVDDFWIGQTEVTNGQYAQCVAAGACTPPRNTTWNEPARREHPVTHVDWSQARAYALWVGGRLPTEAEWEKAARGTDGRTFPWTDETTDSQRLNFQFAEGDTVPVGSYPAGASIYGALDMAGNVEEWVADWYAPDYYAQSPQQNPLGPGGGIFRGVRGGSFHSSRGDVRTSARGRALPDTAFDSVGLRVVVPGL